MSSLWRLFLKKGNYVESCCKENGTQSHSRVNIYLSYKLSWTLMIVTIKHNFFKTQERLFTLPSGTWTDSFHETNGILSKKSALKPLVASTSLFPNDFRIGEKFSAGVISHLLVQKHTFCN